ncbi:hypothetical protein OOK29_32655 [Streptomyces phaeochromogenes]|uniref:Uncharacterized protein n=1 Tax=Streptomyces phaeochromogenes TaxID=1923 RepID=A0ABZ1H417_STRPH|nr:hypothetical protein [Streptomyces phaeochromogenes]MCX5602898.1 hypothetical protein [Streptomyces phaeochromogenes]WSD11873.1 hypothetical protein OHB35_00830 [Streptomyces phaeochromogenes]
MPAGLVRFAGAGLGAGALQGLGNLVGELDHQPLTVDQLSRRRAGVLALEEACGVPQQCRPTSAERRSS